MHIAAAGGYMQIIEMLINAQANLSAKDADNQTPLHYAARNGRVEAVRRLMDVAHDQAIKAAEDRQRAKDKKRKRRNVEKYYRDADISFDFDDDDENFEEYEAIWYSERYVLCNHALHAICITYHARIIDGELEIRREREGILELQMIVSILMMKTKILRNLDIAT